MSNTYFQFKQFIIHQDQCALKVCTDACLLGAWFAAKLRTERAILDIGSGSGLLMMMLAQRSDAVIHGIEIDYPSYEQSVSNILAHEWSSRLKVFHGDAREFQFPGKYDFIISNPPFYKNDLHGDQQNEIVAKHSTRLGFASLLAAIDDNLSLNGSFGVLLPFHRWEEFNRLSSGRFRLAEKLLIRNTAHQDPFRVVLHYVRQSRVAENTPIAGSELNIRDDDNKYSGDFIELLKDYYLHL